MAAGRGGLRRPPFRPWIGALVASLRCRVLRPGLASINSSDWIANKCLPKRPSAGYKYSCPDSASLAGFEVATYGRFSGGHRGSRRIPIDPKVYLEALQVRPVPGLSIGVLNRSLTRYAKDLNLSERFLPDQRRHSGRCG